MQSALLSMGPVFFYDQFKSSSSKRAKKSPEELPADVKLLHANPRLAGFMNSLNKRRNSVTEEIAREKRDLPLVREDGVRREKYSVLPDIHHSITLNVTEEPHSKHSQAIPFCQADDDIEMNPFDEYKYAAPSILYELGKMLLLFARYELVFPQGLVNVLNYSWKELIEGTVYTKRHWQSLAYQGVKPGMVQLEECDGKSTGNDGSTHENTENAKTKARKAAMLTETTKDRQAQEQAQIRPTEAKSERKSKKAEQITGSEDVQPRTGPVTHANASHSPVTISFSMASRVSEQRGWISREFAPQAEDLEWKALYGWAIERLQLAQIQM